MKEHQKFKITTDDIIPYACYYNKNTVLTKDGALLQTLEIKFPSTPSERERLNRSIRKTVSKIKRHNIAVWINIVRSKNFMHNAPVQNDIKQVYFAQKLTNEWNKKHNWKQRIFSNKIYLSIVIAPIPKKLITSIFTFKKMHKIHSIALKKNHAALTKISNFITKSIMPYESKMLSIIQDGELFYSEHMQLYYKILYGEDKRFIIQAKNLSFSLTHNRKTIISFNHIETEETNHETNNQESPAKKYIACFCIKSHYDMSTDCIYQITSMENSASFTETVNFLSNANATKNVKRSNYLLKLSKSTNLSAALEINHINNDIKTNHKTIAHDQTIISIFANSTEELYSKSVALQLVAAKLGINIVRLDIHLERGFFAQLPGNSNYMIYRHPISRRHMIQLPIIDTEIAGNPHRIKWNKAYIAILTNTYKKAYLFNFHCDDIGHTLVLGNVQQRTTVLNFLLTQTVCKNTKIIILDYNQCSRVFINAMGGKYLAISQQHSKNSAKIGINFLQENDSPSARQTIKKCLEILSGQKDAPWAEIVKEIMSIPLTTRRLSTIKSLLNKFNINIDDWLDSGKKSGVFDNEKTIDIVSNNTYLIGIDLTNIIEDTQAMKVFTRYILHVVETLPKDMSTVLVFNEIAKMQHNNALSTNINKWLFHLNSKNTIAIFSSDYNKLGDLKITEAHPSLLPTRIMVPSPNARKVAAKLGIDNAEERWLQTTRPMSGKFILQYGQKRDILDFDTRKVKTINMLYSNSKKIRAMLKFKKEHGSSIKKWIDAMLNWHG
ncbi:hypothetical protein CAXC1_140006 [Candidatus Xenohaliotis californiensis]|uniref:CagE TrbE VirB component of type IV transporter system central domain-containing protein n=1 Tax=Candidatus Xenohaliotis californiensis TaxID=84677 RepID=A0ABP0ERT5_9RICK|nr:hypothetical protein CAXC1_140006 [Candidatus Xenohaliotis californiensis]